MAEQVLKGAPVAKALTERGEREDDLSYERGATKRAEKVGLGLRKFVLPADCSQEWLADVIREVNEDPSIHGCLLFRPLPKTLDEVAVCAALDPAKDVDCITTGSLYGVFANRPVGFPPCTAEAVIELLDYYQVPLDGARVTVVGRSLVIGKPVSMMLQAGNATVTMCHTHTRDLAAACRDADVVVAAAGHIGTVGAACASPAGCDRCGNQLGREGRQARGGCGLRRRRAHRACHHARSRRRGLRHCGGAREARGRSGSEDGEVAVDNNMETQYGRLDKPRVEAAVREFLLAIGEDPDREGLQGTPDRVARACEEIFGGMQEDPATYLRKQFREPGNEEMVVVRDIPFSSMCEHHLLPFVGHAHVCYIPRDGRITGLSKIARCVSGFARRPQLQERLTGQIADAMGRELDPLGVLVVIEADPRSKDRDLGRARLSQERLEEPCRGAEAAGALGRMTMAL